MYYNLYKLNYNDKADNKRFKKRENRRISKYNERRRNNNRRNHRNRFDKPDGRNRN